MATLNSTGGAGVDALDGRWLGSRLANRRDQILVLVVLLAIWQGLSLLLGTYWVGTPWGVAVRLYNGLLSGEILRHAGYTISEAMIGFVIGGIPAVILPFLLRRLPIVSAILDPFMVGGYGSPKLALAPLFILWFGIGFASRFAFATFICFFPVVISTLAGLRETPPDILRMCKAIGASDAQVMLRVRVPFAVPYIFAGLKIAATMAVIGVVIGEFISADKGLGYVILYSSSRSETPAVMAAIVLLCAIGLALYGLVELAEWAVQRSQRG
jgi:NitT/TauT family transport system permease protein